MRQLPNSRIRFGVRGWAATAVAMAILAAIAFLAIGIFIFLLPVLVVATILFWFLPKPTIYRVGAQTEKPPPSNATIIEGDFKVIDGTDDKLNPPRGP